MPMTGDDFCAGLGSAGKVCCGLLGLAPERLGSRSLVVARLFGWQLTSDSWRFIKGRRFVASALSEKDKSGKEPGR